MTSSKNFLNTEKWNEWDYLKRLPPPVDYQIMVDILYENSMAYDTEICINVNWNNDINPVVLWRKSSK